MRDLPNILTVLRVALIPILIMAFFIEGTWGRWVVAAIFTFASVTDYFDGFLARKYNAYSSFGRVLDPIADKLLVASTLMMLIYERNAPIIPTILILCREITVSGLREYLAEFKVSIPVTRLAKFKTATQFIAIIALILNGQFPELYCLRLDEFCDASCSYIFGHILIWIAAALTLMTGYAYCKEGFKKLLD
jgi:cardiolipin synthase (CMP-forming)